MEDKLIVSQVNSKGYGILPKMVMQDQRLHINAKAIYAYFASFAGAGNCAFPTRKKICYDLGISGDTYGKYLKQLTDCGYISVKQNKEKGKFSNNVYTLCDTIEHNTVPEKTVTENIGNGNIGNENVGTGQLVTNNNKSFKINKPNINKVNINSHKRKSVKGKAFTPPTFEEVSIYCESRGNLVDAKKFFDYYDAGEWKDAKGNPVKNWKQKCITWENGETTNKTKAPMKTAVRTAQDKALTKIFKS